MRKRIIKPAEQNSSDLNEHWLNLEQVADVELTSEDVEHPIENALWPVSHAGWRAGEPGEQTIRLIFNPPQHISRIRLSFTETNVDRTQEYHLQWLPSGGSNVLEIIRQQWNFSVHGSTHEAHDHHVNLPQASILELIINPDISGGNTHATLDELRLA